MAPGVGLVDFVEGDTEHDTWCITRQPCTLAVHAEANALVHAAKYGVGVKGAELHTTRMPCLNCAGLIINAEIKRVVWYEPHRQNDGLLLLEQAGLVVVRYSHD
jgi:dCMP deaminase